MIPEKNTKVDRIKIKAIKGFLIDKNLLDGGIDKKNKRPLPGSEVAPKMGNVKSQNPDPKKVENPPLLPPPNLQKKSAPVNPEKKEEIDSAKKDAEKLTALALIKKELEENKKREDAIKNLKKNKPSDSPQENQSNAKVTDRRIVTSKIPGVETDPKDLQPEPEVNNFQGKNKDGVHAKQGVPTGSEDGDMEFINNQLALYAFNKLKPIINKNWVYPNLELIRKKPDLEAKIRIRVDTTGNILSLEIFGTSGYVHFDESCITAIKRSVPLPEPPKILENYIGKRGIIITFPGKLLLEKISGDDL